MSSFHNKLDLSSAKKEGEIVVYYSLGIKTIGRLEESQEYIRVLLIKYGTSHKIKQTFMNNKISSSL